MYMEGEYPVSLGGTVLQHFTGVMTFVMIFVHKGPTTSPSALQYKWLGRGPQACEYYYNKGYEPVKYLCTLGYVCGIE